MGIWQLVQFAVALGQILGLPAEARQLAPAVIAVLQYGGTGGCEQSDDREINTLPLTDPSNAVNPYDLREEVSNGTLNTNLYRIHPGYANSEQEENETNSSYNSLQAGLQVENQHGLTLTVAYTWSHEIDIVSNDLGFVSNPFNIGYDRGSGQLDRRNILNASYIYALPFFAHSSRAVARTTPGGWEISGVTTAESGVPNYITYTGTDTVGLGSGGYTNRPNLVAPVSYQRTRLEWFSTSSFASPVAPWNGGPNQGFGDARKDAVVGPGLFNANLSLFKTIPFTASGGTNLELRFEYYNVFNHTQFEGLDDNTADANFGQATSTYDPRTLQLGAKFHF